MIEKTPYHFEKNYISIPDKEEIVSFLKEEKGLDFSGYSEASVRRRVSKILSDLRLENVQEYITYLRNDSSAVKGFIERFTVNVTEMFRDPQFYKTMLIDVLPTLQKLEKISVWSAGCSSGEELLSLAILFKENGLLERTTFLGSDLSPKVLEQAKTGSYKERNLATYEKPYFDSGGKHKLGDYYSTYGTDGVFDKDLRANFRFEKFNLVTDVQTQQFDLVVCRNVLIYFNSQLQNSVFKSLNISLKPGGFLAVGSKESVIFYEDKGSYIEVKPESKIYQKNQ